MKRLVLVLILSQLSSLLAIQAYPRPANSWTSSTQEQAQQRKTRPRRTAPAPEPEQQPQPSSPEPLASETPPPTRPFIRVALAVDVPSAVVSCDQEIVRIDEASQQPIRLAENEVHLETIASADGPLKIYRVQVAVMRDRGQADGLIQRLRSEFQEEVTMKRNGDESQQLIYMGRFQSEAEAVSLVRRLRRIGYGEAKPVDDVAPPKLVLVARSVKNELLLWAPSQLTFAPLQEAQAPLKFSGRAYRGRLLVQLNPRDRLTVVNELPLEEYLWSVTPNELGPATFGEIEALKAQAVAARTFAVRQKLMTINGEGYDVQNDVRSQVYTGIEAERPLSTRAVNETGGIIVTYHNEPIEAVYTSTCGGRTENSESVFAGSRPYLRSVLCAPEANWLAAHTIVSQQRLLPERPIALLQVLGLKLPPNSNADVLKLPATADEIVRWITDGAALAGRAGSVPPLDKNQLTQLNGFARALVNVFYPEDYTEALFTPADVDYILDTDGATMPPESRAAMAVLVRDGVLRLPAGGHLNPQAVVSRADALAAVYRVVERAGLLSLPVGTARFFYQGLLIVDPEKGEAQRYQLAAAPFLFKLMGQEPVPVTRLMVAGGEKVWFHTDASGRIDYLEEQPNPNGVARDRYSPVSRWETRMTAAEVTQRLRSRNIDVGSIVDLRVLQRGASQRIAALEVLGPKGRRELRGSAIRSALGLRENLFVIDRKYDDAGHVVEFVFTGRGWGHGVGLCQVGAYGLALEGFTYKDILKTYYTGVEITKIY